MNPMTPDIFRALFALLFVIGLLWLLSYALRKYGAKLGLPTVPMTGKARRLQLLEVLSLDQRNKLVLVRQDDQEYLLLVGQQHSQIIHRDTTETA
jgi:flagellar biosynthetic protein FliO